MWNQTLDYWEGRILEGWTDRKNLPKEVAWGPSFRDGRVKQAGEERRGHPRGQMGLNQGLEIGGRSTGQVGLIV